MFKSPERRRRVVRAVAPAVGLLTAAMLVWQGSYSAFTATTTSPGNAWAAGTVALTNDTNGGAFQQTGVAAFTVTKMVPNSTGVKCIVVQSTTDVPSTAKLYFTGETKTLALDAQLTIKVEQAVGQFANCASYPGTATVLVAGSPLSTLATSNATYANGLGPWAIAGTPNEFMTYRITYTLSGSAPNGVMGGTAKVDFVWEADSL